jgi:RNA polymerase subunit RPABC4/transcription elongation factor Spt4
MDGSFNEKDDSMHDSDSSKILIVNSKPNRCEMFFFIGGVQPKTVTLNEPAKRCDACGLYQLSPMRTDHYLSVFFIPILPIKKGNIFFRCKSCGTVVTESKGSRNSHRETCKQCGSVVDPDFQFCPSCGQRLNG